MINDPCRHGDCLKNGKAIGTKLQFLKLLCHYVSPLHFAFLQIVFTYVW